MQPGQCQPVRQEFMENECEALPGVAYPGVRDNCSTINTKTGYDDDDDIAVFLSKQYCMYISRCQHKVIVMLCRVCCQCANCGKEALFYCCWNTSYCDYPCQLKHWPRHQLTCAQTADAARNFETSGQQRSAVRTNQQVPYGIYVWPLLGTCNLWPLSKEISSI